MTPYSVPLQEDFADLRKADIFSLALAIYELVCGLPHGCVPPWLGPPGS
jgi:hypothetical protein